MVLRSFILTGLCLLVLLAPWNVTGGIMTNPGGTPALTSTHHPVSLQGATSRGTGHASHPIADDGVTHFTRGLRPLEFLPSSTLFLSCPLLSVPGAEKDLLSLTQRRRE